MILIGRSSSSFFLHKLRMDHICKLISVGKSVLENEYMALDMEHLIDTLERTHNEKGEMQIREL